MVTPARSGATGRPVTAMIWVRRTRRDPDRFVTIKTAIFFLGAGTWIAGVLLEDSRVTGVAIVMLAAGLLFRLLSSIRSRRQEEESEGGPGR